MLLFKPELIEMIGLGFFVWALVLNAGFRGS